MSKQKTILKPIDSPVYTYFQAILLSFYSRRLFVDVGKRWKGLGFFYLLLVVALFSIPISLILSFNFNTFFNQEIIAPLTQLPTVVIQNGQASFDKPMPYYIKDKDGQVVIIVDTTGAVNEFTDLYPRLSVLINKDKMTYRIPTAQLFYRDQSTVASHIPITQEFSKEMNTVFDGMKLINEGGLTGIKYASQLMMYPLVVILLFSFLIILFPMLALLAQAASWLFFSFKISYFQASRLLIVSATPMLLLLFLCLTFNIIFAGLGIILIAILSACFSFAVHALKNESLHLVTP